MTSQVVLVSGCSSGFGLLIAVAAARKGHKVFATMRKLAAQFGDADSPFGERSKQGLELIDQFATRHARDPREVVNLVLHLMTHPNPPLQTLCGLDAKMQTWLRSMLPARWWERAVRKAIGLP